MYLWIENTLVDVSMSEGNTDESNTSAESGEDCNDSDFKPFGDSLTSASSSDFSSGEELSDESMPNKHQFTRKIFPKKHEAVIDKDIFSFNDFGEDDDDNGDRNETMKSIIDNLVPGKDF